MDPEAQQAGRRFVGRRRGDELCDDVQAATKRVARHVGVVAAEIVLLQMVVAQPCARFQVELEHFDVRRQLLALDESQVLELGIVAEHAACEGFDEPSLEIATPTRYAQRQRSDDGQAQTRIGDRAGHE